MQPDSEFRWPKARKIDGGFLDLRTSGKGRFGHYTAHLLDSDVEIAFIAACNPHLRLLVLYLFVRHDFPWVGNWEERYSRVHVPWEGREFCRGFEFSSPPFPIPRRSVIANGELFGESTYKWLSAKGIKKTRYMILMLDVPKDFIGVASVQYKGGYVRVYETQKGRVLRVPVKKHL